MSNDSLPIFGVLETMIKLIKVSALSNRTHHRQFQEFVQNNLEKIYPDAKKRAPVAELLDNAKKYESADVLLFMIYCNTVPIGFTVLSLEGSRANILNLSIATTKQRLGYSKLILNKLQGMYKTLAITIVDSPLTTVLQDRGFTLENSTPIPGGESVVCLIRQELHVSSVPEVSLTLPADVMMTVLKVLRRNIRRVKTLQSRYRGEMEWEVKGYGGGNAGDDVKEFSEKYDAELKTYLQIEDAIEKHLENCNGDVK